MAKQNFDTAFADYVDFKIEVKQAKSRPLQNALNIIETKYARKMHMVEKGLLSEDAAEQLSGQKMREMAAAYTEHVIVGWEGKFKGKALPEFTEAGAIDLLSDKENFALFLDLIAFSGEQSNFEAEVQKAEGKNSKKSSAGGDDTAQG